MVQLIIGAVTGFLGPIFSSWVELKKKKLEAEERENDRKHQLAMLQAESSLRMQEIKLTGDLQMGVAQQESFDASYKFANENLLPAGTTLTSKQKSWIVFAEVSSKLIRPFTTAYYQLLMAVAASILAYQIQKTGAAFLSTAEAREIFKQCMYTIFGMAETTLLWWYGIRRMSEKKV